MITFLNLTILALFILVFLIVRFVHKRFNLEITIFKRRIFDYILLSIVSIGLFFVLRGILLYTILSVYPQYKFEKVEWHSNPELQYQWSKDLIKSEMLVGKTKTDVVSILGSKFYTFNKDSVTELVTYHIGLRPSKMDLDVLTIIIQDGKVVKVKQSTN